MANDRARDNDESHNKIILKKTLMGDPKPDILNESATSHTIEKQPNIKTALREYIATDIPSWKKNPQDTMRKFGRILRQQHPNIEENLRIIHANPYYQSSSKYYSSKSDSFEVRTLNKKEALGLRKSWSLLNLKSFKNRTGIQLDYLDKTENISTGLVRTNSFNTRHDLKSAKIRNPIFNKFSTQKSRRSSQKSIRNLNGSSVFPPQNIINYFDAQCSSSEESSDDGDQNSEFDFKEILNGKEQTDLHNTIVKFFGAETLKWDSALNQPEGSSAQSSAAAFSMKDVMELTLLHAEQMQVLSSEYEYVLYNLGLECTKWSNKFNVKTKKIKKSF